MAQTGAMFPPRADSQVTEHLLSVTKPTNQLNTVQYNPNAAPHVNSVLNQAHREYYSHILGPQD